MSDTNATARLLELLRKSKKFLAWHPAGSSAKPKSKNGIKTFEYVGKVFKNQGESHTLVSEKHFTPQELATTWGLSVDTIREIFTGEPGVLVINRPETRHKRRYRTFRVPESVAARVHNRLSARV
jgi:hypothetical protein